MRFLPFFNGALNLQRLVPVATLREPVPTLHVTVEISPTAVPVNQKSLVRVNLGGFVRIVNAGVLNRTKRRTR